MINKTIEPNTKERQKINLISRFSKLSYYLDLFFLIFLLFYKFMYSFAHLFKPYKFPKYEFST